MFVTPLTTRPSMRSPLFETYVNRPPCSAGLAALPECMCVTESRWRAPVASDAGLRLVTGEVVPAPDVMRPTKLDELHRSGLIAVCWDVPRAMATNGITHPLGRGSSGGTAD